MPPVRAVAKQIGASTKRLKPILDIVRGKGVAEALDTLSLLTSPWAKQVAKVVQSAAANAENNMLMDRDGLRIVQITADQAVVCTFRIGLQLSGHGVRRVPPTSGFDRAVA